MSSTVNEARVAEGAMRIPFALSVGFVLLMAVQSVLGLVFPNLYLDEGYVLATWFGNDLVTLVLAVPVLIAGLILETRNSVLGRLLWLGGLGYGVYNFAFYLFGASLNAYLPLYIITFLLALVALILAFARTDANGVGAAFNQGTPVRLVGGYLLFVAVGLTLVWLVMWAAHIFTARPVPPNPEAFKIVAALDLTLMVPALATGGILLWRRQPLGYVIASIAGIQGSLYLGVLALNALLFIMQGSVEAPGELPVWGTLAIATTAATLLLLANVSRRRRDGE